MAGVVQDTDSYPMYSNRRNALVLVRGEKEVLCHYVNLADVAIPLLGMEWQECKKVISKHYKGTDDTCVYVNTFVAKLVKSRKT